MQALEDLATSWEAKAKHWKRVAAQQRGSRCHDDKARLIMKSELAAGHARELRSAMAVVEANMLTAESFKPEVPVHQGQPLQAEQDAGAALAAAIDADVKAQVEKEIAAITSPPTKTVVVARRNRRYAGETEAAVYGPLSDGVVEASGQAVESQGSKP
jgi:hypothetical protein